MAFSKLAGNWWLLRVEGILSVILIIVRLAAGLFLTVLPVWQKCP